MEKASQESHFSVQSGVMGEFLHSHAARNSKMSKCQPPPSGNSKRRAVSRKPNSRFPGNRPQSLLINYRYQPFLCLLARLRRISAFMLAAPEPWAPVI